jgi:hypothetical protein
MNSPKVRMIKPQERNLRIGRMNILTNPSTTAMTAKANQAAVPSIDMRPRGARIRYAAIKPAMEMSQWMKNFIGNTFLGTWHIWIQ